MIVIRTARNEQDNEPLITGTDEEVRVVLYFPGNKVTTFIFKDGKFVGFDEKEPPRELPDNVVDIKHGRELKDRKTPRGTFA